MAGPGPADQPLRSAMDRSAMSRLMSMMYAAEERLRGGPGVYRGRLILSGHDRSDGGLVTTLLEMAFAGNCGIEVNITPTGASPDKGRMGGVGSRASFAEELGMVIEYLPENEEVSVRSLKKRYTLPDASARRPGDTAISISVRPRSCVLTKI